VKGIARKPSGEKKAVVRVKADRDKRRFRHERVIREIYRN